MLYKGLTGSTFDSHSASKYHSNQPKRTDVHSWNTVELWSTQSQQTLTCVGFHASSTSEQRQSRWQKQTTVIDYTRYSYSVSHTVVPTIVVIVASTFNLSCFASYGRLFFSWHPWMAHKEKKAYTLYKEPLEVFNMDGCLISLNSDGIIGSILSWIVILNRR